MQGRLQNEAITFAVTTECAHCARPLHIEIDADLRHRVLEGESAPLLFTPIVDFKKLTKPSIIDDF